MMTVMTEWISNSKKKNKTEDSRSMHIIIGLQWTNKVHLLIRDKREKYDECVHHVSNYTHII